MENTVTARDTMGATEEGQNAIREIKESVATYINDPLPKPKEESLNFVGGYVSSVLALYVVITTTFAALWALVAEILWLRSALPEGVNLIVTEAKDLLKKTEKNLEEVDDDIKSTMQKVTEASENGAKVARKVLEDNRKELVLKLKLVEETIAAVDEQHEVLLRNFDAWLAFLSVTGLVAVAITTFLSRSLLAKSVVGGGVLSKASILMPGYVHYTFVMLMVVACYRLVLFLYGYFVNMYTEGQNISSRLRQMKQQQKAKKALVNEILSQQMSNLDVDAVEDSRVQDL